APELARASRRRALPGFCRRSGVPAGNGRVAGIARARARNDLHARRPDAARCSGTNALWDPWQGSHNGKGLTEDAFDNATKVILNQDFVSGLTQPAKLLDYFPYLAPPPES
ncbi:MAG: hypothetical protein WAN00_19660, partial [Trebonia sp.]